MTLTTLMIPGCGLFRHQPAAACRCRNSWNRDRNLGGRPRHSTLGLLLNNGNAVLAIEHGATAATTRPSTPGVVSWIGWVAPTNALARDIVFTEV